MKKKCFFLLLAISLNFTLYACDICGCGVGSSYVGLLPEFRKTIFGFRYRYNALRTHIGAGGTTSYLTSDEKYNIIEAYSAWNIGKRWRLMAVLPYNISERYNQGEKFSKTGLGDASVQVLYQLLNARKQTNSKILIQSLYAGVGLKLPTGKYNPSDKQATNESPNLFQLGTGSFDFNISAYYDLRIQDAGLNTSVNYKINTTNRYHYQYGNRLSTSMQLYYKFKPGNRISIAPNTGIQYENAGRDDDNNLVNEKSGGTLTVFTIGTEIAIDKISVGGNWQTPIRQNLAGGFVKANNKMMLHISLLF